MEVSRDQHGTSEIWEFDGDERKFLQHSLITMLSIFSSILSKMVLDVVADPWHDLLQYLHHFLEYSLLRLFSFFAEDELGWSAMIYVSPLVVREKDVSKTKTARRGR